MSTRADVITGVALAVVFLAGLFLAALAVGVGLCSLWGERCTDSEQAAINGLTVAAVVTFASGPVVAATVRRQPRWLLALPVEAAVVGLGVWLTLAF